VPATSGMAASVTTTDRKNRRSTLVRR
jgi:hypothetical protein